MTVFKLMNMGSPKSIPFPQCIFFQKTQSYSANERILLSDSGTSGPKCTKLLNFDRYLRLTPTDIELSAGDDSIRLIDGGAYSNEMTRLIAYISDMDLQSHTGEVSVLVSLLFWVSDGISVLVHKGLIWWCPGPDPSVFMFLIDFCCCLIE